jgi:hypothetical protein
MWSYLLVANVLTNGVRYELPLSYSKRSAKSHGDGMTWYLGRTFGDQSFGGRLRGVNVFCPGWMSFC